MINPSAARTCLLAPILVLSACSLSRPPLQVQMRVRVPPRASSRDTGPGLPEMCYVVKVSGEGVVSSATPAEAACLGAGYYSPLASYAELTSSGVTLSVAAGLSRTIAILGLAPCPTGTPIDSALQTGIAVYPVGSTTADTLAGATVVVPDQYNDGQGVTDLAASCFTAPGSPPVTPPPVPGPQLTGVNPSEGSWRGGVSLTLTGAGFDTTTTPTVMIGPDACLNAVATSSTTITCTTPASSTGNQTLQVKVANQGSAFSGTQSYDAVAFLYVSERSSVTNVAAVEAYKIGNLDGTLSLIQGVTASAGHSYSQPQYFAISPKNQALYLGDVEASSGDVHGYTVALQDSPGLAMGSLTEMSSSPFGFGVSVQVAPSALGVSGDESFLVATLPQAANPSVAIFGISPTGSPAGLLGTPAVSPFSGIMPPVFFPGLADFFFLISQTADSISLCPANFSGQNCPNSPVTTGGGVQPGGMVTSRLSAFNGNAVFTFQSSTSGTLSSFNVNTSTSLISLAHTTNTQHNPINWILAHPTLPVIYLGTTSNLDYYGFDSNLDFPPASAGFAGTGSGALYTPGVFTPDGNALFVPGVGTAGLGGFIVSQSGTAGALTQVSQTVAMDGSAGNLLFDYSGRYLYWEESPASSPGTIRGAFVASSATGLATNIPSGATVSYAVIPTTCGATNPCAPTSLIIY